jgi:GDP-L-fucose synthase
MRIWVTGGGGMLGTAVLNAARARGGAELLAPRSSSLDLRDRAAVRAFLASQKVDAVVHAAARVGGIAANMADMSGFLTHNLEINLNLIAECAAAGVPKLLNIGSSCMYPKDYRQPLVESDLLAAPLEPTNEGYALAKIVAARHCDYSAAESGMAYRTIIPCNLYGPGDNFSPAHSHLIASIIRKIDEAKREGAESVEIWGDGSARREFLYAEDLADWIVSHGIERINDLPQYLNLGFGRDHSVREYYAMAAAVMGYEGEFRYDLDRPIGMRQKLMDSSRARAFGWAPGTSIEDGLARTYHSYLKQAA